MEFWNFEKYHGKITENLEKWEFQLLSIHFQLFKGGWIVLWEDFIIQSSTNVFEVWEDFSKETNPRFSKFKITLPTHQEDKEIKRYLGHMKKRKIIPGHLWTIPEKIMEFCQNGKVGTLRRGTKNTENITIRARSRWDDNFASACPINFVTAFATKKWSGFDTHFCE